MSKSENFSVTPKILFVYLVTGWLAWLLNVLAWISRFSVSTTSGPRLWPHNHLVVPLWLLGLLIVLVLLQFNDVILEAFHIPREIRKGCFYVSVFMCTLGALLFAVESLLVLLKAGEML